jgi:predicted DNA-binding transcriptional regulator YafY
MRRTIHRHVADLMAQGAPISGETGFGYGLPPGLFLPHLMSTEDEVEAAMLGLRYVDQGGDAVMKAAADAMAKIGAVPSHRRGQRRRRPRPCQGRRGRFRTIAYRSTICAPRSASAADRTQPMRMSRRRPLP